MKTSLLFAACLVLACSAPVFAQNAAKSGSADAPAASASPEAAKPAKKHAAKKHHMHGNGQSRIDHSDDHLVVNPPVSKFTVPATQ